MMTMENAEKIGRVMGKLLEFDRINTSCISVRRFIRIRVEIDTTKPFPTGFSLPRIDRGPAIVTFKYERLSEFCYECGCLGHVHSSCPTNHGNNNATLYGQGMRIGSQE